MGLRPKEGTAGDGQKRAARERPVVRPTGMDVSWRDLTKGGGNEEEDLSKRQT